MKHEIQKIIEFSSKVVVKDRENHQKNDIKSSSGCDIWRVL